MNLYVKSYQDLLRDELYDICRVRMETFIVEQGLNYVDLDEQDQSSIHVWMADDKGIQAYVQDLYAKEGFVASSELFLEEGIEHIEMVLNLT